MKPPEGRVHMTEEGDIHRENVFGNDGGPPSPGSDSSVHLAAVAVLEDFANSPQHSPSSSQG